MEKIRAIISTGQGRLHLFQSAIGLKRKGVAVTVISGWIPGRFFTDARIRWMGKVGGIRHDLVPGFRKRKPDELNRSELKSCGFAEFFIQGLFKLSAHKFLTYSQSAVWGWKLFGRQSRKYIRDADIFHVRSGAGAGGAIEKARKKGMKILVDHSIAHPSEMQVQLGKAMRRNKTTFDKYRETDPSDKFWRLVLDDCLKADLLLVNSEYVRWSFVEYGYDPERIRVAYLGVNAEFDIQKADYDSKGKIKLVFTGGFGARKGAGLIIEALEILKQKGVDFSFEVVGSVTGEVPLPDWINESPDIKLHGHLPQIEMAPILLSGDIYIFPSYTEGSAQSVKEAMAVGLPVITTKQSGAPIEHQRNGWIIADDDAAALAEAIIVLKNDTPMRKSLGLQAAATIRNGHTWEKYSTSVIDVYRELLK